MRYLIILFLSVSLAGCTTAKKYWPRDHDPVMFDRLVMTSIYVDFVDCEKANWERVVSHSRQLARYAEWRGDPQAENLAGLYKHAEHMSKGGSKVFCELGKDTAMHRINAVRSAWEGR